ncbi:DUF7544 domain-containing protein [Halobacterium zhouii]|uniref:DUF7544 domain-containing protein n=1 Tax=Halobacterium zhouii TaxID=2902624 RepID=UPI001E2E81A3|nr:hypothetical protein [Halobacterium zhouii]
MSWYAVRALDEALSETRSMLLPFDLGVWVRLAFISLFAGLSTPQVPSMNWSFGPTDFDGAGPGAFDPGAGGVMAGESALVAAVLLFVAAVVVVGVLFLLVGAVMEFVLVSVLRSRAVRILRPFRAQVWNGVRLFGFRVVVGVVGLVAFATVAVPAALAAVTATPLWLLALVVTIPLLVVVAVLAALALEFTTAFVVPLMDEHDDGVFAGWRRLWPTLRAEWKQFGVYVLVKVVLLVGAGFVTGLAVAIVAVPLVLLVGAVGYLGSLAVPNVAAPVVVALVAATVVALVALAAVSVPIMTFLRYHSLCTLASSPAEFDLRQVGTDAE